MVDAIAIGQRNIGLTIAFDGAAYHGWQVQPGAPTIQGLLSAILEKVTGEAVTLNGSGRTDSGTHARGLVANFHTGSKIPAAQLLRACNAMLPRDIRILGARDVPVGFHARKSAHSKVYRYQIYHGAVLPPHLLREYFHFPFPMDYARMESAAHLFVGEHDFAAYAKTGSDVTSTVRTIFRCDLRRTGSRIHLTVEGSGFLHHMVRNMAGTLLEVARGRISIEDFAALFDKRDRTQAGFTAPACGLILIKVNY
ncbi:MAG: tRNA pseudouridine(38-40) synthase TruA [Acidobacteriota bacterium]|jgi:tRNA pseudouridine38-40 synthase|nr:tRNA pseudouridine(38-40) synthase TruA [Acidobacteriota bacterium]